MIKLFVLTKRDRQFTVILLGVFVFAILWRFLYIGSMPSGLSREEIGILDKAFHLTQSWRVSGNDVAYSLYLYLIAIVGTISHFNILVFRIIQASISIVTIVIFYFFTKEWFERRVALFATLFLSINAFYLVISRIIDPAILAPLFLILITYLFTLAFEKDKYYLYILAGFASGLSLYVDKIFFMMPIIFALSYGYFIKKNPEFLKKYWRKVSITLLVFLIVAIPYLSFLPETIKILFETYNPGSLGRLFLGIGTTLSSLLYSAPVSRLYYIGSLPLLSPFIAITFLCGLVYALFHIERRRYYFLIISLFVLVTLLSLGSKDAPANYIIIIPVIFIFSATIFDYLLNIWFKTFPNNRIARVSFTLVLSFFVFLSVIYNYQKFFEAWGKNKEVKSEYNQNFDYSKK